MNRRLHQERLNYETWRLMGSGEGSLKPPFCRIGSKYHMADNIIKYFPKSYNLYVEPFAGGGGIFWRKGKPKKEDNIKEVLNDLDKKVYSNYKLISQVDSDNMVYLDTNDIKKIQSFINKDTKTKEKKFVDEIIYSCNGFSSNPVNRNTKKIYSPSNPFDKIKNIKKYQERIKGVKIHNLDYMELMKKYDGYKTFFYLDPPYENSNDIYENSIIDYCGMSDFLRKIKGKFLMSLSDSANIRKIFQGFKFREIPLITNANKSNDLGGKKRVEILISNY